MGKHGRLALTDEVGIEKNGSLTKVTTTEGLHGSCSSGVRAGQRFAGGW
ncbi:hypothetical protein [Streptomyces muensis]|uniref:Uncharacterized protein n=1 Tax=Streptomyces muensis TaxID=1077944 RepID=A0A9X1Q0K4_STRM4|nr:hypothetical protein [Streptomyces muensis]MCF1595880.1 hypothetical protein [Streptomyces muensis]